MKEPRKLSLQEEMERELQRIEKELAEHPELVDIEVTEAMDAALLTRIRAYEKEKAEEEAVRRELEESRRKEDVEFSEELVPDMAILAEVGRKAKAAASGDADILETVVGTSGADEEKMEMASASEHEGEKKIPYRRKKRRYLFASLVAVLVLVLGLGMTSVGSKSYWKVLWEKIHGEEPIKFIDVEDMKEQESKDGEDITVYRDINKKLGITVVQLIYIPKEMKLESYSVNQDLLQAKLFFKYKEEIIRYTIYINNTDSSWGEKEEDTKVNEYIVNVNNQKINVEEFSVEGYSEYRQVANFEYRGVHYQLKGIIKKDEFQKILENLFFS